MMNHSSTTKRTDQRGMAAILITMVTMVVVSLIVLGFATISRREQGQSLDRQLSTQAFYAAESGVEDARNVLISAIRAGKTAPSKADCTTNTDGAGYTPNYPTGAATVLDSAHDVSYTCLLVDPNPTSLVYNGVESNSVVAPLASSDTIDKVVVTWSPTSPPSGTPASCPANTNHTFTPATKWTCGYGVMRLDLVPTDGTLTRTGLESSTLAAFFEPTRSAGSGTVSYAGSVGKAALVSAQCGTASYTQCSATITGLPGARSMALRINSLYQPSNVTITGYHGNTPIKLNGAQAVIDATGRANGVLRRIQVRIPVQASTSNIPDYAIESNSALCKRFLVTPGYFSIPSDIQDPDLSNQMCVQKTSGTPQIGG